MCVRRAHAITHVSVAASLDPLVPHDWGQLLLLLRQRSLRMSLRLLLHLRRRRLRLVLRLWIRWRLQDRLRQRQRLLCKLGQRLLWWLRGWWWLLLLLLLLLQKGL